MNRTTYENITAYNELARSRHLHMQEKLNAFISKVKEAQDYLADAKAYLASSAALSTSPSSQPGEASV
jgi:hypothetical protein